MFEQCYQLCTSCTDQVQLVVSTPPASTEHPAVAPAARLAAMRRHWGALLLLLLGLVSAAEATMNRGICRVLPADHNVYTTYQHGCAHVALSEVQDFFTTRQCAPVYPSDQVQSALESASLVFVSRVLVLHLYYLSKYMHYKH